MNNLFKFGVTLKLIDNFSSSMKKPVEELKRFSSTINNISTNRFVNGLRAIAEEAKKTGEKIAGFRNVGEKLTGLGKDMTLKGAANLMIAASPTLDAAGFEKAMAF